MGRTVWKSIEEGRARLKGEDKIGGIDVLMENRRLDKIEKIEKGRKTGA